jgi:hypothetical protein
MKRYTITNTKLNQTWVMECEDLNSFYANGLPAEYIGADIQEQDITQETADRKTQQELKRQQMLARVNALSPLVGKSLSQVEIKQAVEILLAILLNGESTLAIELLKLRSSN